MKKPILTVVLPCYNEEEVIKESIYALKKHVEEITEDYEIILVDDGSGDNTFTIIEDFALTNSRIKGIRFTRNFGKEAAIHAGLTNGKGAAVVIMDADLQHPPELLQTLFRYWKEDKFDVVEAVKSYTKQRKGLSSLSSSVFNLLMSKLTGLKMTGASDYKLLDRKVVNKLLEMPEKNRFFRGLVNWTGYKTKQVPFEVQGRAGGETKWSSFSLFRLSISAITSFSNIALQLITFLGIFTLIFSLVLATHTLYNKISGKAVSGFATVIILSLMLNSVIMISLGIIGIYLANIYVETKRRPFYIVAEEISRKREDHK